MNLTGIESQTQNLRSRYRGCLLAGAVGDALGAPIEMMSLSEIRKQFGEGGLTTLAPAYGGIGMITDDTQMSLFTAEGLLRAQARQNDRGLCNPQWIVKRAYFRWLMTQGVEAPGMRCPSSLRAAGFSMCPSFMPVAFRERPASLLCRGPKGNSRKTLLLQKTTQRGVVG
ncbi:MAG: ADP-ribosylglycohydrolase family protein [Leptospirales bacterium]